MKTCKDTNIIENDVGRSTTITPASGLQDLHTRSVFITIPEANYEWAREWKVLDHFAAVAILKAKHTDGIVPKKELSINNLSKIWRCSRKRAKKLFEFISIGGTLKYRENGIVKTLTSEGGTLTQNGDLHLRAWNAYKAKKHRKFTIEIAGLTLQQVKIKIIDAFTEMKVKRMEIEAIKSSTKTKTFQKSEGKSNSSLTHRYMHTGYRVHIDPLKLSCKKLGDYIGYSPSGASKMKRKLKTVVFERNRQNHGWMYDGDYKRFCELNKKKAIYRSKKGYVHTEGCSLVRLTSSNRQPAPNTNTSILIT